MGLEYAYVDWVRQMKGAWPEPSCLAGGRHGWSLCSRYLDEGLPREEWSLLT